MHPDLIANLSPSLTGKKVLLGITGSIAAFKACDIVRFLRDCGAEVRCVLTPNGARFVTPLTLENISGQPVGRTLWETGSPYAGTHHVDAARWADVALVAPATANTIAKLAHGIADDLLTTELLAFQGNGPGKLLIAPAMNPAMFAHPATQANLALLCERGATLVGPTSGETSCGELGQGRMLEPQAIVQAVARAFYQPLNGKKALITLGPTQSALDPVRYLTNRSSGRMGAALAWAARRAGYAVQVVAGPADLALPEDASVVSVRTAGDMYQASSARFDTSDLFIATAAVLDWEVPPAPHKLKKEDGAPQLTFTRSTDILAELASRKRSDQFVLGFAAETQDVPAEGARKRLRKNCDALFANDVSGSARGFESSVNAGWWIDDNGVRELPPQSKVNLADALIALIGCAMGRKSVPAPASQTSKTAPLPSDAPSAMISLVPRGKS